MSADPTIQTWLTAIDAKQVRGDTDAIGVLIGQQTDLFGLAIAVACRGEVSDADETTRWRGGGYLAESAINDMELSRLVAQARFTPWLPLKSASCSPCRERRRGEV